MPSIDFTHLSPRNAKHATSLLTVANGAVFKALLLSQKEKMIAANVIYMHIHKVSRKCYVGIAVQEAAKRWLTGIAYQRNRRFGNALRKHGWSAFESYVLAFAKDRASLNRAEVKAIAAAGGHKSEFTYNLSPGGEMVAENDKPIIGVFLPTGKERKFKSGSAASRIPTRRCLLSAARILLPEIGGFD